MADGRYTEEIDILDLIVTWLERWRLIVVGIIVFGVAGAYRYYMSTNKAIEAAKAALAQAAVNNATPEEIAKIVVPELTTSGYVKNIVLFAFVYAFVHGVIVSLFYILDKRVKYCDKVGSIIRAQELTHVIDWKRVDKKHGFDRCLAKWKIGGERRIEAEKAVKVDAVTIADVITSRVYSSVLIISNGLEAEAKELSKHIKENCKAEIKITDSITHSVEGAKSANTDAAVMLVKVKQSRINDIVEERNALQMREIDVIGVVVYK